MIPTNWLLEAKQRIAPYIHITPLTYDPDQDIYFKWENRQITGSFKARGAINKILSLEAWEQALGLVTASAGNHGQGVALAGKIVSAPVIVFASEHAVPEKVQAMRRLGAEVRLVPGGYGEAEMAALDYSRSHQANWISPYNDGQVIAGQGTLALEAIDQNPALINAVWVVPVGGGGLISGVGSALKFLSPSFRLIGVQSDASPFFYHIFYKATQDGVLELPSLADGLAGPVETNSVTISLVKQTVEGVCLVSEADIESAIAFAWQKYGERIEGSGAVSLAAVLTGKILDRPAVVVISGGNIQSQVHDHILQKGARNLPRPEN
jgi:threonine dehydratase